MRNTKQEIFTILINANGEYISGETISDRLNISRNAVCKHIKSLKQEGFDIEATTKLGYRMGSVDIMDTIIISDLLETKVIAKDLEIHKTIDSTNTYIKRIENKNISEGFSVISEYQTAGRGRLGRTFFSEEKGIYTSILLRPSIMLNDIGLITIISALAVVRAIENACGITADIKWTNDVLIEGKKVCGILTEASLEAENSTLSYVVVGIGINANQTKFDKSIKDIATSLYLKTGNKIDRNSLISNIYNEFDNLYYNNYFIENKFSIIQEYKNRLCVLNKEIYVFRQNKTEKVKAIDIDENGHLVVQNEDGVVETLISGEVSIIAV